MQTKQEIVQAALEEIGIASWAFDIQPEQYKSAAQRMDDMVAEWQANGILLGFNMGGDLAEDSGLVGKDVSAVKLNLAARSASSYGKVPSAELKLAAANAYQTLVVDWARPRPRGIPGGVPLGAGRGERFSQPRDLSPFVIGANGEPTFNAGEP